MRLAVWAQISARNTLGQMSIGPSGRSVPVAASDVACEPTRQARRFPRWHMCR